MAHDLLELSRLAKGRNAQPTPDDHLSEGQGS